MAYTDEIKEDRPRGGTRQPIARQPRRRYTRPWSRHLARKGQEQRVMETCLVCSSEPQKKKKNQEV